MATVCYCDNMTYLHTLLCVSDDGGLWISNAVLDMGDIKKRWNEVKV